MSAREAIHVLLNLTSSARVRLWLFLRYPSWFTVEEISQVLDDDAHHFIKQEDPLLSPARTSIEGVFVAGTAAGPMDIPDSILSAGAASAEAINYIIQTQ